jgi:RNA polymerase sigma-70 factor, ECF subfamily
LTLAPRRLPSFPRQAFLDACHDQGNVWVNKPRACTAPGGAASCTAPDGEAPSDAGPPEVSFEQLYDRWFYDVSCWVRALGARDADRDDLVQDVFLVAHRRLASFDGENPAGWLYQIARRKVRDYRRLAWVKHFFATDTIAPFDGVLQSLKNPLQELETSEKAQLLNRVLASLNVDQRAAFMLFEVEGQSGDQIAQMQKVPLNTVWARIYKARKRLQREARRLERAPLQRPR